MYDSSFDELINSAIEFTKQSDVAHDYMLDHALRSKSFGYNSHGWARIGEAISKAFYLECFDMRVLTDKFILTLAIKLSDLYRDELDAQYEIRKVN